MITELYLLSNTLIFIVIVTQTVSFNINCDEPKECFGHTIPCSQNTECNIYCNGLHSCQEAFIDASSSTDVTIDCKSTSSCEDTYIVCGLGDCDIICSGSGTKHCQSVDLTCGTGACTLTCGDAASCKDMGINVDAAISFECIGDCPSTIMYLTKLPKTSSSLDLSTANPITQMPRIITTGHELITTTSAAVDTSIKSNWIKKGSINCPDGTTDLDKDHPHKDTYCKICPDNTAGLLNYGGYMITGLFFFLFVGFCTRLCFLKRKENHGPSPRCIVSPRGHGPKAQPLYRQDSLETFSISNVSTNTSEMERIDS